MPFGLKNAETTYQRLVNKMFADHIEHLGEMFDILRKYRMKLYPLKCAFEETAALLPGALHSCVDKLSVEEDNAKARGIRQIDPVNNGNPEGEICLPRASNLEESKQQKSKFDKLWKWTLYVKGSSNDKGVGARLLLKSSEGNPIKAAVRFGFVTSNNKAEYKVLLAKIHLAKEMGEESIKIYSDSQLVVHQISSEYQAKEIRA
ncbi:uncharacterized protein LOC116118070 [Pistacia vera]|uniref:uncharacterized protein LOC116118070 n=1 Tax=Pistacia vera TaxID=55513 RepID=UPI001263C289|nr:uncharacterized protein LOC116118070 [Pistacia vera]